MVSNLNLTNQGEELALNLLYRHVVTSVSHPPPAQVWFGLAVGTVSDVTTLSTVPEVTDAGYARQLISAATPDQTAGGEGRVRNAAPMEFGPWTVTAANTITHGFVATVGTGTVGLLLNWFELEPIYRKRPATGETLTVPIDGWVQTIS